MRWKWRWSLSAEDRIETWINRHYQEQLLAESMIPTGPCLDDAFLQNIVSRSRDISLSDPRIDHVASCPQCMARLRAKSRSRARRLALATTAAVCAAIVIGLILSPWIQSNRSHSGINASVVAETVNLWNATTIRGTQPAPLEAVSLPASLVRLTVILPRFSPPGKYLIAVTRDQASSQVVAEGLAQSIENGKRQEVSVKLNLQRAAAGKYFLSTTHEQDQSSYYYPLQIR